MVSSAKIGYLRLFWRCCKASKAVCGADGKAAGVGYRRVRFLLHVVNGLRSVYTVIESAPQSFRDGIAKKDDLLAFFEQPYLNCNWDAVSRFSVIAGHYAILDRFPGLNVESGERRLLCCLNAYYSGLSVQLDRPQWFVREGEIACNLFFGEERIYTIAFTLGETHDFGQVVYVGAIQGRDLDGVSEMYNDLTRSLFGIRPRDFMIVTFQILCKTIGVKMIYGVSQTSRQHNHRYFGAKGAKGANYDQIWEERGGVLGEDGFYRLAAGHVPRSEDMIPSKKRSQYRKRAVLYAYVEGQLAAALGFQSESS